MIIICSNTETICNRLAWDENDSELCRDEVAAAATDAGKEKALDLEVDYEFDSDFRRWNGGYGHAKLAYSHDGESEAVEAVESAMQEAAYKAQLEDRINFTQCAIEQWSEEDYGHAGKIPEDLKQVIAEAKAELAKLDRNVMETKAPPMIWDADLLASILDWKFSDWLGTPSEELLEDGGHIEDHLAEHMDRAILKTIPENIWSDAWEEFDRLNARGKWSAKAD